jgi:hypothetical protein
MLFVQKLKLHYLSQTNRILRYGGCLGHTLFNLVHDDQRDRVGLWKQLTIDKPNIL